jgi:nucleotide-binding universal stress UspA family protein
MYNRILIATDGSELSDKAVDSGLDLAALCGASVIVIKVVQHYPRSYFEGGETVDLKQIERIEGQWTANAQTVLDAIQAKGQARKVSVTTEIVKSDLVAESVIDVAKRRDCDLIVMASHGRKGLQRLLLAARRSMCSRTPISPCWSCAEG